MVLYVVTRLRKIKQQCISYSVPDYLNYYLHSQNTECITYPASWEDHGY